MHTHITSLGRRPYTVLGRLLAKRMPDVAKELIEAYNHEQVQPAETDLSRLEFYFQLFAPLKGMSPDDLRGNLHKSAKIDIRREFVSCMVHLFNPQVYLQPGSDLTFHFGFLRSLSTVLGMKEQNILQFIRECILQERVYEEYAALVNGTIEQLVKMGGANGSTKG